MRFGPKAVLGVAAVAGALAYGTAAHAYLSSLTINKCLSGKVKTVGKGAAGYTGCYSKGASKNVLVDSVCLSKSSTKLVGAFGKLDLKPPCETSGDGASRDADTATFGSDVNALVGDGDAGAGKCDAAKQKLVGKYVAGITGCYAKAAGKTGTVDNAVGGCTDKVSVKFQSGVNKAELKGPCTTSGPAALVALQAAANQYIQDQACALDPSNPACAAVPTPTPTSTPGLLCGNGANDPGEACDASAPSAGWATCGSSFTCVSCNCACPSTVTFSGDPTAPESVLDTGWTGISHRAPIISNGQTTINLSCGASTRPCGVCTVSGPVENPNANAGQLATRRCTNDSSIQCTSDAPCTGGGGTCQFFFGAPLPLAAGGVTTCVVNQFNGSVSGTANVETGQAETVANLTARVYNGIAIDNPCPRCLGDTTFNDGVQGGTCDGGARVGLVCDSNGDVPARPSFGRTSLDCPPNLAGIIATLPIDLSNKTDVVTKTLTGGSPNCTGAAGNKCLCDTCNNANADPCSVNADCPISGGNPGVCGGRRCLSGANNGLPCSVAGDCPGGSCTRPGEPTKPASCLDDTSIPNTDLECSDGDADGEGECDFGPDDQNCSVASGLAQRGCTSDGECGGGVGSCEVSPRKCFLTGGGVFQPAGTFDGTDTLSAVGMADTPMQDVSNPTLAAVFCVAPTGASAVNNVAGLPGPSRITLKGQAVGQE